MFFSKKFDADTVERISDVSKRMNATEDVLRKHILENERVITAEINERQNQDKVGSIC